MEKFYLGMDIGTESVGMACTDERYNLLRAKRKDLWAVRLFDEAKDASERRAKRTARRRLQRRRQRIEWLQDIFDPFIDDKTFFIRLNNSAFYEEDKDQSLGGRFSLFNDVGYTDADFYREFPTIFHLRRDLINGTNKMVDLRHYYLALHHIIKYRGHFLFEGEDMNSIRSIENLFQGFNAAAEALKLLYENEADEDSVSTEFSVTFSVNKVNEFKEKALKKMTLKDKRLCCEEIFQVKKGFKKEWIGLFLGASVQPKKLFIDKQEEYKDVGSIEFKKLDDEKFKELGTVLKEEEFDLLVCARGIYNFLLLEKYLDQNDYISETMVVLYEKHKADLRLLKDFVEKNYSKGKADSVYYKIFRSVKEKNNYVQYIGYTQANGRKHLHDINKKASQEDFYNYLKNILGLDESNMKANKTAKKILSEMESETFLPKIAKADNGVFPRQINEMELDVILENLCKEYPALGMKDEDGLTPVEKIKKIFRFKIPYYVGPLNTSGANAWMKRNEGETDKIRPWNFDRIVNKSASNEEFIRRMTNKCTYLRGKDVLPKASMYYQAFDVLNQINKLTINGAPIPLALKQEIFKNVYLTNKKVGAKQIQEYLVRCGYCTKEESKNILGGFDSLADLKANMNSYVTFKAKFGSIVDERPEIFENIILWHTLNTDKSLVEESVLKGYGDIPEIKDNIKWIKGLTSFKDFGRLSKELLCGLVGGVDEITGEVYTVLNRLYHTNDNFNQVLYNEKYTFQTALNKENSGRSKEEISYEDIKELSVSPMARRGIWQALQMADEYVKAVGRVPDKIFVEFTRKHETEAEKKKNKSKRVTRKEQLKMLYRQCEDVSELVAELDRKDITDLKLRQESLYLYFKQKGRCAYSGERINIDDLARGYYDVDHIVPQSRMKDDSLDNKVLVKKECNIEKSDSYPIPVKFIQKDLWKLWKDEGLISQEKYARLIRREPLTEDEVKDFINRQLVITNQTVKAVATLLRQKYEPLGTKVVYSKADNVNRFKSRFNIVKCRETNDLHHARDAYLNIVVGNVYHTRFQSLQSYTYSDKEGDMRTYNLDKLFNWHTKGAWNGEGDIDRVKAITQKTSMCVTRYAYTNQGAFYDANLLRKDNTKVSCPRKGVAPFNVKDENGLYKYGGYSKVQRAYFTALEYADGKKRKKVILGVPIVAECQIKGDPKKLKEYFEKTEGLKDVKILVPKIKKDTLISYNGYKGYITGESSGVIKLSNAIQWFSKSETDLYVKGIVKLLSMVKDKKLSITEQEAEEFDIHINKFGKKTLVINREKNLELYETIINQISLKVYQSIDKLKKLKEVLEEKKGVFATKSVLMQAKLLFSLVSYLRRGDSTGVDLKELGASSAGDLRPASNITKVNFAIIHQSPCGLVERIQKV